MNTSKWPTTKSKRLDCINCGKQDTCLVAPDGGAFYCHRSGKVHQAAGQRAAVVGTGYVGRAHRKPPDHHPSNKDSRIPTTYDSLDAAVAAASQLVGRDATHTATWTYWGADGETEVMAVARFDTPDGKECRPFRRTKAGWQMGDPDGELILYGVRDLIEADPSQVLYVVEGEKPRDAAHRVGLLSTTSSHGSGSAARTDWAPAARFATVVILRDNDAAGEKYARDVSRLILKINPQVIVKVVLLPGLPPAGDIVEFIAAREGDHPESISAEIEVLALNAPALDPSNVVGGPVLRRMSDVRPEKLKELWPRRIYIGKLNVFAGDPCCGKSTITMDFAGRVTTGRPWPDGSPCPKGDVIILSAEDDLADTIRPRLDAAGADCSRVIALEAVRRVDEDGKVSVRSFTMADLDPLEEALRFTPDCKLVIIDPFSAYLGATDSHVNAEVRGLLAPLSALASKYGVAVVMVTHLSKAAGSRAMYRAMGSLAFVAAARTAWLVSRDRDNPDRRLFTPIKNNLGTDNSGYAFTIEDGAVAWQEQLQMTADEALDSEQDEPQRPGPKPQARDRAEGWLRGMLLNGPTPVGNPEVPLPGTLRHQAGVEGISWASIDRASRKIGVRKTSTGYGAGAVFEWSLPDTPATNTAATFPDGLLDTGPE